MSRGMNIAAAILLFGVVIAMLSGSGFFAAAGMSVDSGLDDDVDRVNEEIGGNQSVDDSAGGDTSFLGFTKSVTSTLTVLWVLITSTSSFLQTFFHLEPAYADGLQTIARFALGLFIVQVIRGMMFE